jgi:membrane protein
VNVFDRVEAAYDRGVARARKRWKVADHGFAAWDRFEEVLGGRLAAAISYYGFFAAFSLAVVAYSVLGHILNGSNSAIIGTINNYLATSLPWVRTTADQVGTTQVTVISTVAAMVTGVAWVDSLRSSTRAIWGLDQHPGNWIIRRLIDLGMLLVLGGLLALSLATTSAINAILDHVIRPSTGAFGSVVLRASAPLSTYAINLVLASAILLLVPRLRLSPRRFIPAAVLISVGIQVLNTIGAIYISRTQSRPAYQLVAGAVGLLVYLYLLNQLILFGTAIAATSAKGSAADLAAGRAQPLDNDSDPGTGEVDVAAGDPANGSKGSAAKGSGTSPAKHVGEPRSR